MFMAISFRSKCFISFRFLHTSGSFLKSNPEWKALQKKLKSEQDRKWKLIEKANKFKTNVGLRHQIKAFGITDPSDPTLTKMLDFQEHGSEVDISDRVEGTLELTRQFENQLSLGIKKKNLANSAVIRRAVVKKKYFPDPVSPNLLTFVEKEIMKSLYHSNPAEWSFERLAECFPATPAIVKKVVRNRKSILPNNIERHDSDVRKNWKLVLSGELRVSDELQRHLQENCDKISTGLISEMSQASYKQLVESVIKEHQKKFEPIRKEIKGEFGQIIADYNKKAELVAKQGMEVASQGTQTDLTLSKPVMVEEQEHLVDMPSPWSDTALINVGLNLSKERSMTMEQFKKKFLKKKMKELGRGQKHRKVPEESRIYFQWFKEEEAKNARVQKIPVSKLSSNEIEHEIEAMNKDSFFKISKKYLTTDNDQPPVIKAQDVKDFVPVKINIPNEMLNPGGVYKIENDYYDSNGNFLFRIPTEKQK